MTRITFAATLVAVTLSLIASSNACTAGTACRPPDSCHISTTCNILGVCPTSPARPDDYPCTGGHCMSGTCVACPATPTCLYYQTLKPADSSHGCPYCADSNADAFVSQLPTQPGPVNFRQYSGYVDVGGGTRRLFYYFVTSASPTAQSDPIVLWLNGGPGCSSLAGAFAENGPFFVSADGTSLISNANSWNKVANMLYLESPVGTGFSYALAGNTQLMADDVNTVADQLAALRAFFGKFSMYSNNRVFLAGQSYAGHWLPLLAKLILDTNPPLPPSPEINHTRRDAFAGRIDLRGILAGNPITDSVYDGQGGVEFLYGKGFISKNSFEGINALCDFSQTDSSRCSQATLGCLGLNQVSGWTAPLTSSAMTPQLCMAACQAANPANAYAAIVTNQCYCTINKAFAATPPVTAPTCNPCAGDSSQLCGSSSSYSAYSICPGPLKKRACVYPNCPTCLQYLRQARQEMGAVNVFNVYADLCQPSQLASGLSSPLNNGRRSVDSGAGVGGFAGALQDLLVQLEMPFVDNETAASPTATSHRFSARVQDVTSQCNDRGVETYLNLATVRTALHVATATPWVECVRGLAYSAADLKSTGVIIPVWQSLFGRGILMTIFSGDTDAVVPFTSTRKWIASLNRFVTSLQNPWLDSRGQIGGYGIIYENTLTFTTLREAGHLAAGTQGLRALDLFKKFVSQTQLL